MDNLRSRVAKKADRFVKLAQQAPAPAPKAPAPPVPGAVPPADGAPALPVPGAPAPAPKVPGAPAPKLPGAAPAPGGAKSKEEIEQEVEKDIRKSKEQEQKLTDLNDKVTDMGAQLEGLSKSMTKLVNLIQKDMGEETDYEQKFEDLKDKSETGTKVSSPDFGSGKNTESLIVSKEDKMSAKEQLRKARVERLAEKSPVFEETTPSTEGKTYKPISPVPPETKAKDAPEDWVYTLIAADMAMDLNEDGSAWTVVNKHTNQAFYVLRPTAENKEIFATEDFAKGVIKDVKEVGVGPAMDKWKAEPVKKDEKKDEHKFPGKEDKKEDEKKLPEKLEKHLPEKLEEKKNEKKVEKKLPEKMEEKLEEKKELPLGLAPKSSADDFKRRFIRAFRLALSAQQKNLTDNPLKAAWFEALASIDVENPEHLIESTFSQAAAEQFEVALAKTAEYLDLSDESFVELESQIGDLKVRAPESQVEKTSSMSRSAAIRERAINGSLPISSASDSNPSDKFENLQAALPRPRLHGLRGM
jgi:hypothetical protein